MNNASNQVDIPDFMQTLDSMDRAPMSMSDAQAEAAVASIEAKPVLSQYRVNVVYRKGPGISPMVLARDKVDAAAKAIQYARLCGFAGAVKRTDVRLATAADFE